LVSHVDDVFLDCQLIKFVKESHYQQGETLNLYRTLEVLTPRTVRTSGTMGN
jgi:hypothetical protein